MGMSTFHLINVWTDPELGAGGFVPMTDSLLWLPGDFASGHAAPAFVFLHRWGGYPHDAEALELGPRLADKGFVFLSLCLRRRGMEGQLNAMPDDDLRDIKLAVDFLHTQGCRKVFLIGQELGGYSALRYQSKHRDRRVSGLLWLDAVDEPSAWLRESVGDVAYQKALTDAGIAARQGAAMDVRIDLFPDDGPAVTQQSLAFLSWWAPSPAMGSHRNLDDLKTPLTVLTESMSVVPALLADNAQLVAADNRVDTIATWAARNGAEQIKAVSAEALQLEADGRQFFGLLWSPATNPSRGTNTAVVIVHGLTSSPLSPLIRQLAPVLADAGAAVLAGEMRRSGWAGHETSVLDNDLDDIERWVALLVERGYDKVVLAGASIGSISVGRYLSVRQHPNVVGLAHLMPTAECPDWFRHAAGEGPYADAVAGAKRAVAAGHGEQVLVDVDIRQPPPNLYGGRFRWTQRAAAWLSWFGPEADSRNRVHIANAEVPLLLLSGTADSYNDAARFAELKAAAVKAPSVDEIWYPDIDHGLAGVERQVARDMVSWMKKIGAL
jgi:alpha-beta hydrolase superfamily lysophospholipase